MRRTTLACGNCSARASRTHLYYHYRCTLHACIRCCCCCCCHVSRLRASRHSSDTQVFFPTRLAMRRLTSASASAEMVCCATQSAQRLHARLQVVHGGENPVQSSPVQCPVGRGSGARVDLRQCERPPPRRARPPVPDLSFSTARFAWSLLAWSLRMGRRWQTRNRPGGRFGRIARDTMKIVVHGRLCGRKERGKGKSFLLCCFHSS